MFGFGTKKDNNHTLKVDVHSHLIPGIDDGAKNIDEALHLLTSMQALGYQLAVTTPHIMSDYYRNTPANINAGLSDLQAALNKRDDLNIEVKAAAEYYLDEYLLEMINNQAQLMLLNDQYLLFETGFLNQPALMHEFVFIIQSMGIKPVLAHPERYVWLQEFPEKISDLAARGVLFQVNITSLSGYYSRPAKKLAEKLFDDGLVAFAGSDCHNNKHMSMLQHTLASKKAVKYIRNASLLNNTFLSL